MELSVKLIQVNNWNWENSEIGEEEEEGREVIKIRQNILIKNKNSQFSFDETLCAWFVRKKSKNALQLFVATLSIILTIM